jgi:hypothetical protein
MLHASTRYALHFSQVCALFFQSLQDKIDRFEEQRNRREYFSI